MLLKVLVTTPTIAVITLGDGDGDTSILENDLAVVTIN